MISTEVDLCTLESEKFTETLMGISHVFSPSVSTTHYSLKAVSLKDMLVGEQWIEYTFWGLGKREGIVSCPSPAGRLTGGHIFSMISSNNVLLTLPTQQQASDLQNINIAISDCHGFCGIINKWRARERYLMFIRFTIGSDSKYFRLCGPCSHSSNLTLPL